LENIKFIDSVGLPSDFEILIVEKPTRCMLQFFLTKVNI